MIHGDIIRVLSVMLLVWLQIHYGNPYFTLKTLNVESLYISKCTIMPNNKKNILHKDAATSAAFLLLLLVRRDWDTRSRFHSVRRLRLGRQGLGWSRSRLLLLGCTVLLGLLFLLFRDIIRCCYLLRLVFVLLYHLLLCGEWEAGINSVIRGGGGVDLDPGGEEVYGGLGGAPRVGQEALKVQL